MIRSPRQANKMHKSTAAIPARAPAMASGAICPVKSRINKKPDAHKQEQVTSRANVSPRPAGLGECAGLSSIVCLMIGA